ncbi:hypothetical protein [Sphingomonas sp.]|uniref:hypothetical protein n=1 Tax=Sphingomonas sp. TaxID=28214 RepID=UPI003CC6979C
MKIIALSALAAVALAGAAQPAAARHYTRVVHGPVRLLPHHRIKRCEVKYVAHHRVKKCNYH